MTVKATIVGFDAVVIVHGSPAGLDTFVTTEQCRRKGGQPESMFRFWTFRSGTTVSPPIETTGGTQMPREDQVVLRLPTVDALKWRMSVCIGRGR